jgi:hypothetical protein
MLSAVNTEQILAAIDAEVARLQEVRALLSETSTTKRIGRPPGSATKAAPAKRAVKKRVLSAEARAKIAEAQRERWAKANRAKAKPKAQVTVTRVAAKKAPVKRQPRPVAKKQTALSGSVPNGPVAAPAR